ncbi:hypothetical protein N431DRAFT_366763 [Stipitochalara longipes BDJ]|nr:hypothetical protein N431DRAFT_366763 [Stipitochalara longipes BDJ]
MFTWRRPTSVVDACHLLFGFFKHALLCSLFYTIVPILFCTAQIYKLHTVIGTTLARRRYAPNKLPTTRKRALTIPLHRPATLSLLSRVKQKTVQQTNSCLYSKLPSEIRQQIFELAICGDGNVLHVFREGKKIGVWRCGKQANGQPCSWTYPCSVSLACNGLGVTDDGQPGRYSKLTRSRDWGCIDVEHGNTWGVMALLCSSRQVYSEVIELLYSKPHFHFANPYDIPAFAGAILASRLSSIRILSVDSTTTGARPDALAPLSKKQIADTVCHISSLEEFRIYMKGALVGNDLGVRNQARENFKDLKGLRVFEVYAPRGMAEFWKGFWEERTEATMVIWEDMEQIVPYFGRVGIVCRYPGRLW